MRRDKIFLIVVLILTFIGFLITRSITAIPVLIMGISMLMMDRFKIISRIGLVIGLIGMIYAFYRLVMTVISLI